MFSPSGDMGDEARNWHSLSGKSISSLVMLAFFRGQVLCQYERWSMKKGKDWRIDALELWCWRRLLRVTWRARRSNQSILKEVSPEYSLEGLLLERKVQYFGHLMQRADSLKKTLMLGKIEGRKKGDHRGRNGWMASLTQWTWVWANSRRVNDRKAWCAAVGGAAEPDTT